MQLQNLTTEDTGKNVFNLSRTPVNSAVGSHQKDLTERVISCVIEVHSVLGPGLLKSLYEEALAQEFSLRGIAYEKQKEVSLKYKGKDIGNHRVDYLIESEVLMELKTVETIDKIYEVQVLTYLRAMNKRVGLLVNFNVERLKDGLRKLTL